MEYVKAQKRLCLAALLETILIKHNITNINQIYIAKNLGITLPPNNSLSVKIDNAIISDTPYKWGMNFTEEELQVFFREENIDIEFTYASSKIFEDWTFETFIESKLTENNIICTFDYNTVFKPDNNNLIGHAVLIKKKEDSMVIVFDPGPEESGIKTVDIYDLYVASKRMNGGLWVF